jgi:hypothetical protein
MRVVTTMRKMTQSAACQNVWAGSVCGAGSCWCRGMEKKIVLSRKGAIVIESAPTIIRA